MTIRERLRQPQSIMHPRSKSLSLPPGLLRELGLEEPQPRAEKPRFQSRKQRRRDERRQKRSQLRFPGRGDLVSENLVRNELHGPQSNGKQVLASQSEDNDKEGDFRSFDSLDAKSEQDEHIHSSSAGVSRAFRDRLARDDVEIADLERKLGLKGGKSLPKSFRDDGLGDLLEDIGGNSEDEESQQKRKRKTDAQEWLAQKRQKAAPTILSSDEDADDLEALHDDEEDDEDGLRREMESDLDDESFDQDELSSDSSGSDDLDEERGTLNDDGNAPQRAPQRRENPYVAPTTGAITKYVPPSRRQQPASDAEVSVRIRRHAQGLVNRLTKSNMLAIVADFEKLYREHPRQHVTDAIVDILLTQVADPTTLPDTLLILTAGFATALYRVIGADFGAHLIQHAVSRFKTDYEKPNESSSELSTARKESSNLMTFMTGLYDFKMIGPSLIFDYIRRLLNDLTELNAELLLRIIRMSGHQLRQDDPLALKDIVGLIRPAISRVGEQNISVRTKFMIETINDLKNNKMKAGANASAIKSEHATRMRKLLGSLNSRKLTSTEPLRMGLDDIEQSDKRGKWWLVGASWAGVLTDAEDEKRKARKEERPTQEDEDESTILGSWRDVVPDMLELEVLAREQGMNTQVRRSIFVSLLSAADLEDAYAQLLKLRLNKYDKREMPNVLIQCVGSEEKYNPYYTLVARRICSDRKVQWAFQDSLWKLFRRFGESIFGEEGDSDEDDETLELRRLVNIAKMYGSLIASSTLGLGVLKCVSLPYLQSKTHVFVEVLLITLLQECRKQEKGLIQGGGGMAVEKHFKAVRGDAKLASGLRYFLKEVVRKSAEAKTIRRACDVAEKALEEATVAGS